MQQVETFWSDCNASTFPEHQTPLGEMGRGALFWASRGLFVFPIAANAKQPPLVSFTQKATRDPIAIRFLWQTYPRANVGVLCGYSSRVLVLDVDAPREPGTDGPDDPGRPNGFNSLRQFFADIHGRERPWIITWTPSGGRHLFFRSENPDWRFPSGVRRRYPGLDFKHNNSYVLIAPSEVKGGCYRSMIDESLGS